MSIQSEISRLSDNVSAAFDAIENMGGTAESRNSDDLASAIQTIPSGGGSTKYTINLTATPIVLTNNQATVQLDSGTFLEAVQAMMSGQDAELLAMVTDGTSACGVKIPLTIGITDNNGDPYTLIGATTLLQSTVIYGARVTASMCATVQISNADRATITVNLGDILPITVYVDATLNTATKAVSTSWDYTALNNYANHDIPLMMRLRYGANGTLYSYLPLAERTGAGLTFAGDVTACVLGAANVLERHIVTVTSAGIAFESYPLLADDEV